MAVRMGSANRITEERYNKIKAEAKTPKDDERVMKKYGIKNTSVRRIRNTDNFYEFYAKGTTGRKQREHLESVLADYTQEEQDFIEHDDTTTERIICFGVIMVVFMALIIWGIVYLVARGE